MNKETAARYEVVDELGGDPATLTHLCRLRGVAGFEKDVVIRQIAPAWRADAGLVRRFLDQARLIAKLSHPNIVQIFEVGHDGAGPYLVMEYVKGVDLMTLAAQAHQALCVNYGHIARLIAGLCDAVAYADGLLEVADQANGSHLELDRANVVVSLEGVAKLLDFGLLRREPRAAEAERFRNNVCAVGRMLLDLTTGRRDDRGPDATAVVPSDLVNGYPRALERIILSTLHAPASDRPSLPEVRDLLEEFASTPQHRSNPRAVAEWLRELFPQLAPPGRTGAGASDEPTTAVTVSDGQSLVDGRVRAPSGNRTPTAGLHRRERRRRERRSQDSPRAASASGGAWKWVALAAIGFAVGSAVAFRRPTATRPPAPVEPPPEIAVARPAPATPALPAHAEGPVAPTPVAPEHFPTRAPGSPRTRLAGEVRTHRRALAAREATPLTASPSALHAAPSQAPPNAAPEPDPPGLEPAAALDPAPATGVVMGPPAAAPPAGTPPAAAPPPTGPTVAATPAFAPSGAALGPRISVRPKSPVPIPTLPRVHVADDPGELARVCRAVEAAIVSLAGVSPEFARGATDRLRRSLPVHASVYPIGMYYFLVREAALGRDNTVAAVNLDAAQASGIIVKYKDLPGIDPGH